MSLLKWIDIKIIGDERGQLVSLEENRNIPFSIKRVYYLTSMQSDLPRGFHAHKVLQQVAICLAGSCRMVLDDGQSKVEVLLDSFSKGLIIDPMIWHEMHDFNKGCVLMVVASDYYDETDYIRNCNQYLRHFLFPQ